MKNTILGFIAGAIVVALGFLYFSPSVLAPAPQVGAVSSPDIQGPYFSTNGLQFWSYHIAMRQTASTTCTMKSPAATSTLVEGGVKFSSGVAAATIVELGQSVSPNATTTLIGTTYSVAAGAQASIVASTSPQTGAGFTSITFAPNTYFNVKVTPGANPGVCDAEFMVL